MADTAEMTDEERLAADEGGGDGAPARVLNQDEIDSLLGFDGGDQGELRGIQALVNTGLVNYERLPMLEIVFDRMVRVMSTSLAPVDLALTGSLPPDVSFTVNGDGTATLSGVSAGKAKAYRLTFKATYGTVTTTQAFTLTTTS